MGLLAKQGRDNYVARQNLQSGQEQKWKHHTKSRYSLF